MNANSPRRETVLTVEEVRKQYGGQSVLKGVSLQLGAGETLALVGHNGAGKTTLMKLILGLTHITSGDIRGHNKRGLIGYLPEVATFPPAVSGRAMLRFYARLKHCADREVDALLDLVGLIGAERRRIGTYSKGMRQRLALAQALLGDPTLLLLDEPTSGMDPFLRHNFYDILDECRSRGSAVLLASHALTEIEARASRIAILSQGELLAAGALSTLRTQAGLPEWLHITFSGTPAASLSAFLDGFEQGQAAPGTQRVACAQDQKMALLQKLVNSPEVRDIEIHPPGLDALYAHFCAGRDH